MSKRTILVVDEEKSVREALNEILGDEGYIVLTVASGEEALKLITSESIDIVVMEIFLPDMDGFSLYNEIQKTKEDLPVIMMSGKATRDNVFMAGKMGVYDFLEKPVSLDKLLIMIKRAFDKKTED